MIAVIAALLLSAVPGGPAGTIAPADVKEYLGTWPLAMTNPSGARETVRIWEEGGVVKATVQAGRFPPIPVTGMLKDAGMLVLTATRFENGRPIRAVVALTLEGDEMRMGQMLEFSETIKRGSGRKADPDPQPGQ